jgi:hypothetical protein
MFTGVFTKILVGIIGALVISNAVTYVKYHWWEKPAYEKEIRELQEAGIKAQAKIYKQAAQIKDLAAARRIKARVSHESKEVDQVVTKGNDAAMRRLFIKYGMLREASAATAQPEGKGGPRH